MEGKSVGQTYRDGAGQLADIGKGIGQGYADVYKEHGVAAENSFFGTRRCVSGRIKTIRRTDQDGLQMRGSRKTTLPVGSGRRIKMIRRTDQDG